MSARALLSFPIALTLAACTVTTPKGAPTSAATTGAGGGSGAGGGGGAGGSGAGGGTASVPDLPQVTKNAGMVVASPQLVSITFSDDALRDQKDQALQTIGCTSYWAGLEEYGVGAATAATPVHLSMAGGDPSSISDPMVQSLIDGAISAGTAPPADGSTYYVVFFPGGATCDSTGNYHASYTSTQGGGTAYYIVMPQCAASWYQQNTGVGQSATAMQGLTAILSHELAEGVADPVINAGYSLPGPSSLTTGNSAAPALQYVAWAAVLGTGGGELGDMCAQMPDAWYVDGATGLGFQRYWSNQAAAAGQDPCQPAAPGAYFNTVPRVADKAFLGANNATAPFPLGEAIGIKLAQGQSKTIPLQLYGDVGTVNAIDYTAANNNGDGALKLSIQAGSGNQVMLTVTVTQEDTVNGFESGILVSCTSSTSCASTDNQLPSWGPGVKLWPFVVSAM